MKRPLVAPACQAALLLMACSGPASDVPAPAKTATPAEPAAPSAAPAATPAAPAPAPADARPPAPAGEPLTFTLGERSFRGAVALASQYNGQRRIVISSEPTTCAELLAVPEVSRKGRVSFIVTVPWQTGTHPLASAEILDDDTRAVTHVYGEGTIEVAAGPDRAGERGKIRLALRDAAGGAVGAIEVELCE